MFAALVVSGRSYSLYLQDCAGVSVGRGRAMGLLGSRRRFEGEAVFNMEKTRISISQCRAGFLNMGDMKGVEDVLVQRAFHAERKGRDWRCYEGKGQSLGQVVGPTCHASRRIGTSNVHKLYGTIR